MQTSYFGRSGQSRATLRVPVIIGSSLRGRTIVLAECGTSQDGRQKLASAQGCERVAFQRGCREIVPAIGEIAKLRSAGPLLR